jgi:uncharacterized protein YgbK (DUF1537 family)
VLLIPAFFAGGRYTIDDVHYVAQGEELVPVGATEFARDPEFGFRASNLREWVQEKTAGAHPASTVRSISLQQLRLGGADAALAALLSAPRGGIVVVNAAGPGDLAVLTRALTKAEAAGRRYLYRTAAEFVPAYAGIAPRPLLTGREMCSSTGGAGGLVVVGSYVGRTTAQLAALQERHPELAAIEANVGALLASAGRSEEIRRVRAAVDRSLRDGRDTVLFTSRTLVKGTDAAGFGQIGKAVSSALVQIVAALEIRPRWIVAKGGITSSDLATQALRMRRATVLGQALPGVPVWAPGPESKWPDLPYIVFPGNVGGEEALDELVTRLRSDR